MRLFIAAACVLITSFSWQLGLVELFEHHDEQAETCPDDENGPCDCGDSCHCCVLCAHQAAPAVAPAPVEVPLVVLGVIELMLLPDNATPPTIDQARVPKVPKQLS